MTNTGRVLWAAWREQPTAVTLPLGMTLIGLAAVALGDNASRAFTELGGGAMIRVMGAAMLVGGLLVATGIIRNDYLFEVIGLALAAFGATVYGIGVVLGLGTQGLITGPENLLIAIAFFGRIALISRRARQAAPPDCRQ
ncbi:MAG: hypothetical protein ACRDQZ_20835 [Mycobacteriales bacterium]